MIGAFSWGRVFLTGDHHEQEIIRAARAPRIQRRVQGQGGLLAAL